MAEFLHLPWRTIAKEAFNGTLTFLNTACVFYLFNQYICTPGLTTGPSMLPTQSPTNEIVLVERLSTRLGRIAPGDIVFVRSPENPRKIITKRVTGIEGDQVRYLEDPNVKGRYKTVIVPQGHVWVEGDNVYNSTDSRSFGAVPSGLLFGRVFYRVWPIKNFGPLGSKPQGTS
ncbi:hypothetical protein ACHQM5_018431 [Ranunculus cassubicifolius]